MKNINNRYRGSKLEISIGKVFEFEACHHLGNEEIYGKCSKLHGHTYKMEIEITGEINQYGWICNFSKLKKLVSDFILTKYDHAFINEFIQVPTAENMIVDIYNILDCNLKEQNLILKKIKLYETSTNYAMLTI